MQRNPVKHANGRYMKDLEEEFKKKRGGKRSIGNQDQLKKDKVELDGKTVKEDEEAVRRIKGEALKEKDDPGAFIFLIRLEGKVNENALADTGSDINTMPYRIFETLGRESMKKIDRGITMINHTQAEAMGKLFNVLCQVGVTTIIAKFLILDIPIDRDAPVVVGRGFLHTMGSILNTSERIFSTFNGICHQTFRAARFNVLRTAESDSDDEEELQEHTTEKSDRCNRNAKSRYNTRLAQLLRRHIYSHCIINWDVLNQMGCDGEIDDMLRIRSKKIIKFRLGGCAHILTLLEFAHRLGLYQALELEEDGFNVYFEGGLRSDDKFIASDYWLNISREENLSLSRSHTSIIKRPILRHQNGYVNVAWVIAKWMKRKGVGTQKESQICCGQFILKLARKCRVLTEDVVRSLSAPIYCRDLDTTTFRDLVDSDGKLIPKDPQP
nr:hypothetical protein [Tanacetum cinerariifolium]